MELIPLAVARAEIQFPPGLVIDLAHLRHARFSFYRRNKALSALILELGKIAHVLADPH